MLGDNVAKRVLVTEALDEAGLDLLQSSCQVDLRLGLSSEALLQAIADYDGVVVRSATELTAQVLAAGARLAVVGRAGTGVDNIDLEAATRRGIVVVNAPTSNTVAVAEHTLALMLCLARHIPQANASVHAGRWEKKGLMGTELRDKVLGLLGLGHVGTAVAQRARGLEMRVIAHDPFVSPTRAAQLNVELVDFDSLLSQADYLSLHVPLNETTRDIIGSRELGTLKRGAYLINCARGGLIAEEALVEALRENRIAGAALDVFDDEPHISPALCQCPNLILTPHLGASTQEAQSGAAYQIARQVIDVLEGRSPRYPVNVTAISSEEMAFLRPHLDLAGRLAKLYAQLAGNNLTRLEMAYAGDVTQHDTELLTAAALAGLLSEVGEGPVNLINALLVARERGLAVSELRTSETQSFSSLMTLRAQTTAGERLLSGTLMRGQPHLVRIDDYWLDFALRGFLLLTEHTEQPGVIGQMGTLLGELGVNISFVQVGREQRGGRGLMVLGLDEPIGAAELARVMTLPSILSARAINL